MRNKIISLSLFLILLFSVAIPTSFKVVDFSFANEGRVAQIVNNPTDAAKMRNEEFFTPIDLQMNGDTNVKYEVTTPGISVKQEDNEVGNTAILKDGWNKIFLSNFDPKKENDINVSITSDGGLNENYVYKTKIMPDVKMSYSTFTAESEMNPGKILPWFKFDVYASEWNLIQLNRRDFSGYFDTEGQLLNNGNNMAEIFSGNDGTNATPSKFPPYNPNQNYEITLDIYYGEKTNTPKNVIPLDYDIYTIRGNYKASGISVIEPDIDVSISNFKKESVNIDYDINLTPKEEVWAEEAKIKRLELIDQNTNDIVWETNKPDLNGKIELTNLLQGEEYSYQLKGYYDEIPFMEDKEEHIITTEESTFSQDITFTITDKNNMSLLYILLTILGIMIIISIIVGIITFKKK